MMVMIRDVPDSNFTNPTGAGAGFKTQCKTPEPE